MTYPSGEKREQEIIMRRSKFLFLALMAAILFLASAPKANAWGIDSKPGWFAAPYYGYNYGPKYEYGTEYHFAGMYKPVPRYVGKIRYVDSIFFYPLPRAYVRPYYRY
jgi:hypothetical protein